jgi:hypothetical protein
MNNLFVDQTFQLQHPLINIEGQYPPSASELGSQSDHSSGRMISNGAILQFLNNRKRNSNAAIEDKENNYQNSNNFLNKESTISMQDSSSLVRIDSDYKGQSWQANQIQNQLGGRAAQVGNNNQQVT